MPADAPNSSRRQFIRRGVAGACVFGLAAAATAGGVKLFGRKGDGGSGGGGSGGLSPVAEYDQLVASYRKVDPALIKFRELQAIETGLSGVRGLAVRDDGSLLVAGESVIRQFTPDGARQSDLACDAPPRCVAFGDAGGICVGSTDRVWLFDSTGRRTAAFALPDPGAVLTSFAVLRGEVFAADARARVVIRFDRDGKELGRIGRPDPARDITGFILPSPYLDLAPNPAQGVLWVNNPGRHRVEAYTPAGDLVARWGVRAEQIEGFCGCCNPTHLARLPDGRVVTSEKGLARVKVYDAEGRFLAVVAPPAAFADDATGLDLGTDAKGQIYVLDAATRRVRVFAAV